MHYPRWFTKEDADKVAGRWAAILSDIVDARGQYDEFDPIDEDRFVEKMAEHLHATKDSRICIVGCGAGREVSMFKKRGYTNTVGTTIGRGNIIRAEDTYELEYGIDIFEATMEYTRFDDEAFDCVLARHVFEHTISPILALLEMERILKENGSIFIETPNCPEYDEAIALSERDPYHLVYPTLETGAALMNKANFFNINVKRLTSDYLLKDASSGLGNLILLGDKRDSKTKQEALKRIKRREAGEHVPR